MSFATEPVRLSAALMTLAVAVLALPVQIDVIDESLTPLILAIVAAVIWVVGGFVRSRVSPAGTS